ncbi:MAG: hypothetical protein EDM72_15760 [Chlorobiota bacterium]|nr:MAG: hypothetical protein EDM72_15760 [Chlorobiota bacterium]
MFNEIDAYTYAINDYERGLSIKSGPWRYLNYVGRGNYNPEGIFEVPVYLAKQAKFGSKDFIVELLTNGYCNMGERISRSCLTGLKTIGGKNFGEIIRLRGREIKLNIYLGSKGEEIPEKFKIKIREHWLEKRQQSRYYASDLGDLIGLRIISSGDILNGTTDELFDIAPVRNAEDLSQLNYRVLDMYHETGFRFFKTENDDNVSIVSIDELGDLN